MVPGTSIFFFRRNWQKFPLLNGWLREKKGRQSWWTLTKKVLVGWRKNYKWRGIRANTTSRVSFCFLHPASTFFVNVHRNCRPFSHVSICFFCVTLECFTEHDAGTAWGAHPTIEKTTFSMLNSFLVSSSKSTHSPATYSLSNDVSVWVALGGNEQKKRGKATAHRCDVWREGGEKKCTNSHKKFFCSCWCNFFFTAPLSDSAGIRLAEIPRMRRTCCVVLK